MRKQLCLETMVCGEYQRLLEPCESALKTWNEHRSKFCRSRLIGKKEGDALLRLQAKYARAYALLQRHTHNCLRCSCDPQIVPCNSGGVLDVCSDGRPWI
jgi:hypothetical protein